MKTTTSLMKALVLAIALTATVRANLTRADTYPPRPVSQCSDFGCER